MSDEHVVEGGMPLIIRLKMLIHGYDVRCGVCDIDIGKARSHRAFVKLIKKHIEERHFGDVGPA